jgi:hypothetical protein
MPHLTDDAEWDTLTDPTADEGAKHDARHKLRAKLRNRTAERLDDLYDKPGEPLRSWAWHLHAPKASDKPLSYIHAPLTLRRGAVAVRLSRDTVRLGVHEMFERQFRYAQLVAEGKPTPGVRSDCDNTIEGAIAELAVAQALGLFWQPSEGVQTKGAPDVGPLEVKHTHHAEGDLLVPKHAPDDRPFVLVVGAAPTYGVVGWRLGKEAKHKRWWHRPWETYRVPQTELHGITRKFAKRAHASMVRRLPTDNGSSS